MKIGDFVQHIDEPVEGHVIHVSKDVIEIESEDGFSFQFPSRELIVVPNVLDLNISNESVLSSGKLNETSKTSRKLSKPKKGVLPPIEVDLHIEKLVDTTRGMSSYDMLNLQLDTARHRLEHGIRNRIPRMVFIHGVGEGVLKMELETLFRRYEHIKVSQADPRTYGYGATEVYITQKAK